MVSFFKRDGGLYILLLALVTLLNLAFTILRSARSTLAVTDVGGSATLVPYYELMGTVPAAIAFSWLLSRLLVRFSLPRVFLVTLGGFLIFFTLYAAVIYPLWRYHVASLLARETLWGSAFAHLPTLLFFAVAEMWKVALLSILLWTYVNQFMALQQAKTLYAPVMLGSSLGAMAALPLTQACSDFSFFKEWAIDEWHASLTTQLAAVVLISFVIALLFTLLSRHLGSGSPPPKLSLWHAVASSFRSPYLSAMALIVIVDYLIYSFVEVVLFAVLKEAYPDPIHYCNMMAQMAQWGGILTAVTALWLGPLLLRNLPWTYTALVTPLVVIPMALLFLAIVIAREWQWLPDQEGLYYALWSGAILYCLGRATKYALLDTTKELAFIPLTRQEQLQGKLSIEALASRGGRGVASIGSIVLFSSAGTVVASAPALFILVTVGLIVWVRATLVVGSSPALQHQGACEDSPTLNALKG